MSTKDIDISHDYYADLDISSTAELAEIKSKYKKLALQYHPDRNHGNEAEANVKFLKIQKASDVLTNDYKRSYYDTHRQPAPRTAYSGASGVRGNPYSNVSSQFPPPPTRRKPAPSKGASRYEKFSPPERSAYQASQEGAQARTANYNAYVNMKHSSSRTEPSRSSRAPPPPRPPPRDPQHSGGEGNWSGPESSPRKQARPGSFANYRDQAFPTGRAQPSSRPASGNAPPPIPKRNGFMPNTPGAGDEPPAPRGAYFTQRDKPDSAPDLPSREPAGRPEFARYTPVDPLKRFRDQVDDEITGPRISTPYATHGGEKLNPFESTNINRSKSTREHTPDGVQEANEKFANMKMPRAGSDPNLRNTPRRASSFADRHPTTRTSSTHFRSKADDSSDSDTEELTQGFARSSMRRNNGTASRKSTMSDSPSSNNTHTDSKKDDNGNMYAPDSPFFPSNVRKSSSYVRNLRTPGPYGKRCSIPSPTGSPTRGKSRSYMKRDQQPDMHPSGSGIYSGGIHSFESDQTDLLNRVVRSSSNIASTSRRQPRTSNPDIIMADIDDMTPISQSKASSTPAASSSAGHISANSAQLGAKATSTIIDPPSGFVSSARSGYRSRATSTTKAFAAAHIASDVTRPPSGSETNSRQNYKANSTINGYASPVPNSSDHTTPARRSERFKKNDAPQPSTLTQPGLVQASSSRIQVVIPVTRKTWVKCPSASNGLPAGGVSVTPQPTPANVPRKSRTSKKRLSSGSDVLVDDPPVTPKRTSDMRGSVSHDVGTPSKKTKQEITDGTAQAAYAPVKLTPKAKKPPRPKYEAPSDANLLQRKSFWHNTGFQKIVQPLTQPILQPIANTGDPRFNLGGMASTFAAKSPSGSTRMSASAENISTAFNSEDWDGQFKAGSSHSNPFAPESRTTTAARPRTKSAGGPRSRSPTKSQAYKPPTVEPMPQQTQSPGGAAFDASQWTAPETFTFMPSQAAPNPAPILSGASSLRRAKTMRTGSIPLHGGPPPNSNTAQPTSFATPKGFSGSGLTDDPVRMESPDAMDIDTPPITTNTETRKFSTDSLRIPASKLKRTTTKDSPSNLASDIQSLNINDVISRLDLQTAPTLGNNFNKYMKDYVLWEKTVLAYLMNRHNESEACCDGKKKLEPDVEAQQCGDDAKVLKWWAEVKQEHARIVGNQEG